MDPAEAVQQVKAQFPKLAKCIITEDILLRRLMMLDQRLDVDYFKDIQNALDAHLKDGGHWQEVKTVIKNKSRDGIRAGPNASHKVHGDDEAHEGEHMGVPGTVTISRRPSQQKHSSDASEGSTKLLGTVAEENSPDAYPLSIGDHLLEKTISGDQESGISQTDSFNGVDKKNLPRAVKHGMAIHKNHGQAWEQLGGHDRLAGNLSVRRINPERQEDARRRAVKLGLAIHQDHNENWEKLKSGLGHLRTRSKSMKKPKRSVELPTFDQGNTMPTPLKVGGEVVGIAPSGVLKPLVAASNK